MNTSISELSPVRRVVTGTNDSGLSFLQQDGPSPAILRQPGRPGYQNANIWRTQPVTPGRASIDDICLQKGVAPHEGGTVLRVIDYPPLPKDPEKQRQQYAEMFANIFPDAGHQPTSSRHPGMHITETVDYAIVLAGEITAIMDEGQTVLRTGDILVQRGTNHAWANHGDAIARVAFILVDAREQA